MDSPTDKAGEQANESRPARRGRRAAATVLVVEDHQQVREATTLLLERHGYRVLAAATDDQALWLWDRHWRQVDLVLTDLMIPTHCTGVELARRFIAAKPGLPVILTSGFGRDIGDDDPSFPSELPFLQKPVDPTELHSLIMALLEK